MSEKCGRMQNIKGVIHKCGKTKGHYDNQSLHGCTCGYEWDIRGSYIFSGSPFPVKFQEPPTQTGGLTENE